MTNKTKRTKLLLITMAALLLSAPASALAQYGPRGGGFGGFHPMMGYGMGWLGFLMMFLFWALVITAAVFLVKWLIQASRRSDSGHESASGGRALDILKERYARGEINKEEFERMKADIS